MFDTKMMLFIVDLAQSLKPDELANFAENAQYSKTSENLLNELNYIFAEYKKENLDLTVIEENKYRLVC